MGLAAEAERLWIRTDELIDGLRNSTLSILMEALIFLNCNREFWNKETVVAAYSKTRKSMSRKVQDALEAENARDAIFEE